MGKGFVIVSILFFTALVGGVGWFLIFNEGSTEGSSDEESIICNVGNFITGYILPGEKMGGGEITGIETHSFRNGDNVKLCCSKIVDIGEEYKYCERSNSTSFTHEIIYKKVNGQFIKVEESAPEFGGKCTYDFNEDGITFNRYCE